MTWATEEAVVLGGMLLLVLILSVTGYATHDLLDFMKWVGGSFMATKVIPNTRQ